MRRPQFCASEVQFCKKKKKEILLELSSHQCRDAQEEMLFMNIVGCSQVANLSQICLPGGIDAVSPRVCHARLKVLRRNATNIFPTVLVIPTQVSARCALSCLRIWGKSLHGDIRCLLTASSGPVLVLSFWQHEATKCSRACFYTRPRVCALEPSPFGGAPADVQRTSFSDKELLFVRHPLLADTL